VLPSQRPGRRVILVMAKNKKRSGSDIKDDNRRKFLKWSVFGGATFLLGRIFGDGLDHLSSEPQAKNKTSKEADFKNFRVVETENELSFYDKREKDAILIIEKS
jgi:hypothetical protein